jgi:hypothetical protein
VDVEISPELTPEEREALLAVLAQRGEAREASAWWEAGVRESVEEEAEEG